MAYGWVMQRHNARIVGYAGPGAKASYPKAFTGILLGPEMRTS